MKCPCYSGKPYAECCQPFHTGGKLPENAEQLMRSRYSAYSLNLADYIIETTHPENPAYQKNKAGWKTSIEEQYKTVSFDRLEINEFSENESEAFVSFNAHLSKNGIDISFSEKSRFLKIENRWLYHSGVVHSLTR